MLQFATSGMGETAVACAPYLRVALCCSVFIFVLQRFAVCCSVLQQDCRKKQNHARPGVLHCNAVYCSVLMFLFECFAVCCIRNRRECKSMRALLP